MSSECSHVNFCESNNCAYMPRHIKTGITDNDLCITRFHFLVWSTQHSMVLDISSVCLGHAPHSHHIPDILVFSCFKHRKLNPMSWPFAFGISSVGDGSLPVLT